MRTSTSFMIVALAGLATSALAGPLTPPAGPVTPTYKTLGEVEPRIAINAVNTPGDAESLFRITQPGSYYLTGNITGVAGKSGIRIAADNVTIDLNGFSLIGVPGARYGIVDENQSDVSDPTEHLTVQNGAVKAWPFNGINLTQSSTAVKLRNLELNGNSGSGAECGPDSVVEDVRAIGNGGTGIFVESRSLVRDVLAHENGASGISARDGQVLSSVSSRNDGDGFSGTSCSFIDCRAIENQDHGIRVNRGSVRGCSAELNDVAGIDATFRVDIRENQLWANGGDGIRVRGYHCRVENNQVLEHDNPGSAGIRITENGTYATVRGNVLTANLTGMFVDSNKNALITGNTASGNTFANFSINNGNRYTPIVNAPSSVSFSTVTPGVSSPGTFTLSAEANISY